MGTFASVNVELEIGKGSGRRIKREMEEAERKDYLQRCGLRVGGEDTGAKKSRKLSPPLSVKGQGEGVAARIWPELRLWKKALQQEWWTWVGRT